MSVPISNKPNELLCRIWHKEKNEFKFLTLDVPGIPELYFGMNDVAGQKIFAGDIVERMCNNPLCELMHRGEVVFAFPSCIWSILDHGTGLKYPLVVGREEAIMGIRKIGNKHQNPELLKYESRI